MKFDLAALFPLPRPAAKASPRHSLEILEARIAPALTSVASIARAGGAAADTSAVSVAYTVTFSEAVSGVDAADFLVHLDGNAHANATVTVAPVNPSVYTVTVDGLHGQGDVRLDLIDNDTIVGATSGPLGGAGANNGSFLGSAYHLLQTYPKVNSITANSGTTSSASSVSWTVTLSTPVTGVDASDFILLKSGVTTDTAVVVTGSGTTYTVTATGVNGAGTLALKLMDNGSIKDGSGNPLQGTPPPAFTAQASPGTGQGSQPNALAVADLNGDGKPDLVTANSGSNTVSVFLGDGVGGFAAKTDYATGSAPTSVVVADVNGDGRADLVVANRASSNVSVLLGDGSGGFASKRDFTTGGLTQSVVVADLNGDGKPDLAALNVNGNSVSVLLNDGDGSFGAKIDFATGDSPRSLAVVDVNGDSKPDLVTANFAGNTASVLLGNGSGGFAAKMDFDTGSSPQSVVVADVNADGIPDLITTRDFNFVSVLLGTGNGAFAARMDFATTGGPFSAAVIDVNGDGKLDLVTANPPGSTISVLLGDGNGGFAAKTDFTSASNPQAVAVADLNRDGKPDLLAADKDSDSVGVLLNSSVSTITGDTITIQPITVTLGGSGSVPENSATGLVYTFTRAGDLSAPLAINFTKSGTATFTSDFTASSSGTLNYANGTLSIPAGSASATVTLVPVNDQIVEGSEPIALTVAAGAGYVANGSSATGTIADNDTATLVFVTSSSAPLENAGSQNVGVRLLITANGVGGTGTLGKAVSVNVQDLLTGTATGGGTDFSFTSPTTLTFAAGSGGSTQNVTLALKNDAVVEGTETVNLALNTLADPTGQVTLGGTAAHTVRIFDDDTATIGFAKAASSVGEAAVTDGLGLVLTIVPGAGSTGAASLGRDVSFNVIAGAAGTATGGGTDYTLPGVLTFAAGSLNGATQTANLAITDDRAVEGSEAVALGLALAIDGTGSQVSVATGVPASHTATIVDNDIALIRYLVSSSTVGENAGADSITFRLDFAGSGTGPIVLSHDVTFAVTSTGGTATSGDDYTLPASITYAAGSGNGATRTAALGIVNDASVEGTETATLGLTILSDGTGGSAHIATGGFEVHTTTITDDDSAAIGHATPNSSVSEAAGNDPLDYVLTITPGAGSTGTPMLAKAVTFNATATGGTAMSGADFTLPATLTFAAGSLHGATTSGNLAIVNDADVEGSETVIIGAVIATDGTGGQVTIANGAASHTTTITDDDTATIGFVKAASTIGEGTASDALDLVLNITPGAGSTGTPSLARDVTFNLTTGSGDTAIGGIDYTSPSSVTFAAGTLSGATQTVNLAIVNDALVEGSEAATFGLAIATDPTGGQVSIETGAAALHTVTIADDDTATIGHLTTNSTVSEAVGSDPLGYVLTITPGPGSTGTPMLAKTVTFNATVVDGTATSGVDFMLPSTFTFASGSLDGATTSGNLAIINDSAVEGTETAVLSLSLATDGTGGQVTIATGGHTTTITDDDTAHISYVAATGAAREGGADDTLDFQLAITPGAGSTGPAVLAHDVSFHVTNTGGTAVGGGVDYTLPGTVTFAAGSMAGDTHSASLAVVNDAFVEGTETAILGLAIDTDATGGQVDIMGATHTTTIKDDDTATIGYTSASSTVGESDGNAPLHYVLTITPGAGSTGPAQLAASVTFHTTATGGTATGGGSDYTLPGQVTFASGSASGAMQTANLAIVDNSPVEPTETAILGLSIDTDGTGGQVSIAGTAATHTVTIFDNDSAVVSIADASVLEGHAGLKNLDFTISLSTASYVPVTVSYATANGTAIAPGDYTAIPLTQVTFAPGDLTKTISVPIYGDTLYEGGVNEAFTVNLSAPFNASLGLAHATGTILNDDAAPANLASIDAKHSFTFLDANFAKVTVKLTGAGSGTVALNGGVTGGADISEIHLHGTDLKSALTVTVAKDVSFGGGVVSIGEVTTDGNLGFFIARTADFNGGGFRATGTVKAFAARDFLHGEVITAGAPKDKLALAFGHVAAGTLLQTGETISGLTALDVGAAVVQAPAITTISVTAGSLAADITSVGALSTVVVKGGSLSGHLSAASFGAVSVTGGSFSGSLTSLTLAKTPALKSLIISGGSLTGDIHALGALGTIAVRGGSLSGALTAASYGAVSITGGDFGGSLTSLTSAATLGKTKALTSLAISGGNLTGDIRLHGASGAIAVVSKPALVGGNIIGASIVASALAGLTVTRDFTSSIVLAGADLGADHAFGGGDDTFATGTIGAVKIGGNVSGAGTLIGAGFSTANAILKDSDDAIIGGVASVIASLTVTGTAAPESYFAGHFKTAPKIAGKVVAPASDARFKAV